MNLRSHPTDSLLPGVEQSGTQGLPPISRTEFLRSRAGLHSTKRVAFLKELKKHVRGVRGIERRVSDEDDPQTEIVQGYCLAVPSALTDDGRPPLYASGLKLQERLTQIEESLERLEQKGGSQNRLSN